MNDQVMFSQGIHAINEEIQRVKLKVEKYFSDTSIPLEERWSTFVKTPSYLKNHSPYIWHFKSVPDGGDLICYEGTLHHVERCQTVKTTDVFFNENSQPKEIIDKLKEEFLQNNLGSFVYDW